MSKFWLVLLAVSHNWVFAATPRANFLRLTEPRRVEALERLEEEFREGYALTTFKESFLKISTQDIFKKALAHERALPDPPAQAGPLAWAEHNVNFFDRLKLIEAQYQDSHLFIGSPDSMTPVTLGFALTEVPESRKFLVSDISPEIMAAQHLDLKIGDEIIELDGEPVEKKLAALGPYISAGSPASRRLATLARLTQREFLLPRRNFASLTVRRGTTETSVQAHWYYERNSRSDQSLLFAARDLRPIDDVFGNRPVRWASATAGLVPTELGDKREYGQLSLETDNIGYPMTTGFFQSGGKNYGYVSLRDFSCGDTEEKGVSIVGALRAFLKKLSERDLPLIIDVRANGGGGFSCPNEIFSLLLPKNEKVHGISSAYPLNITGQQMLEAIQPKGQRMQPSVLDDYRAVYELAMAEGDPTPPYFVSEIIENKSDQEYRGELVLLTSPFCMSACEIFAALVATHERGKILGEATAGTGGSLKSGLFGSARTVGAGALLRVRMPNLLFGLPMQATAPAVSARNPGWGWLMENRPIRAQEQRPTERDVLTGGADLLERAATLLN